MEAATKPLNPGRGPWSVPRGSVEPCGSLLDGASPRAAARRAARSSRPRRGAPRAAGRSTGALAHKPVFGKPLGREGRAHIWDERAAGAGHQAGGTRALLGQGPSCAWSRDQAPGRRRAGLRRCVRRQMNGYESGGRTEREGSRGVRKQKGFLNKTP